MRYIAALLIVMTLACTAFGEAGLQSESVNALVTAYKRKCWQPDIAENKVMPFGIIQEAGLELIASASADGYTYELYGIPESDDCIAIVRADDSIYNVQYINADPSHDYYDNGVLEDEVYNYLYFPNPDSCWRWDGNFVSYFLDGSCVTFVFATPQDTEPRTKIYNQENTYVILDYIPEYANTEPCLTERLR